MTITHMGVSKHVAPIKFTFLGPTLLYYPYYIVRLIFGITVNVIVRAAWVKGLWSISSFCLTVEDSMSLCLDPPLELNIAFASFYKDLLKLYGCPKELHIFLIFFP